MTTSRTTTSENPSFADREIIASEPATRRHPTANRETPCTGISRVLLAPRSGEPHDHPDGDIAYTCDECLRAFETANSAFAHMGTHGHSRLTGYPLDVIKLIVRMMRVEEVRAGAQAGRVNVAAKVAAALNRQDVPTRDGKPWDSDRVSAINRRWRDRVRVRVDRRSSIMRDVNVDVDAVVDAENVNDCDDTKVLVEPTLLDVARDLVRSFERTREALAKLTGQVTELAPEVNRLAVAINESSVVADEVADKASRWDEMQRLFGK